MMLKSVDERGAYAQQPSFHRPYRLRLYRSPTGRAVVVVTAEPFTTWLVRLGPAVAPALSACHGFDPCNVLWIAEDPGYDPADPDLDPALVEGLTAAASYTLCTFGPYPDTPEHARPRLPIHMWVASSAERVARRLVCQPCRSAAQTSPYDPVHIVIPWVARNAAPLASNVALRLAGSANILAKSGANMCTGSYGEVCDGRGRGKSLWRSGYARTPALDFLRVHNAAWFLWTRNRP